MTAKMLPSLQTSRRDISDMWFIWYAWLPETTSEESGRDYENHYRRSSKVQFRWYTYLWEFNCISKFNSKFNWVEFRW